MKESQIQTNFDLLANNISEFSLNVFNKIRNDNALDVCVSVGFRIVNIDEKNMIGQI